jgi:hypothetical protein
MVKYLGRNFFERPDSMSKTYESEKRYDYRQILGTGTGAIDDPMIGKEGCVTIIMTQDTEGQNIANADTIIPEGSVVSQSKDGDNIVTCPDGGNVNASALANSMVKRANTMNRVDRPIPN